MKEYLKDGWNWVHLLGSCVLSLFLFRFIIEDERAFIAAFVLGVLWEGVDEINKRLELNWPLFDKRGFDMRDVAMDFIGVLLALCFWFDVNFMVIDILRYLFT